MAGNNRDVELALRVTTLGQEGIRTLEQQVRDLGAEGGAAAPKFNALADEIARLGQSAHSLDSFNRIATDVQDLTHAENANAEAAAVLFNELQKLGVGTRQFEQSELAAKEALRAAQRELNDKKDALRLLRIETDSVSKKTDEYQEQVRAARTEIVLAERNVRDLRDAYQQAKGETKAAADAEADIARRYADTNRESQRGAQSLRERNEALLEARGALAAAGISTDDLRASSLGLVDALNKAGLSAQNLVEDEAKSAAAAKEHAREEEYLAGVMARTRKQMEDAARAEADGIIRDFERMQKAERDAAAQAQLSAQALDKAFRDVGGRSVQAITEEIGRVQQAMLYIGQSSGLTGAEIDQAMARGQRRVNELERELRAANGTLSITDRVVGGLKTTFGQFASAFTLVELVQRLGSAFFKTNKDLDGLRLGLNAIYKDSTLTGAQIDYLRNTADRAGISIGDISQSFLKFVASTKSANIPLEQTNALFAAITRASGTLGLSGEDVSRMLNALGQMAAKGVVSMEELRQQLGDSLPGAFSLTAKGLGITERQLITLVESGNLAARDLFPALTKSLEQMSGEVNTLSAAWERFKNFLTITSQTLGDTGAVDVMKAALTGLGAVLGALVIPLSGFLDLILTTVRGIGAAVAALMSGDLKNLGPTVQKLFEDALDRQANLARAYQHIIGMSDESVAAQGRAAQATAATGAAAQAASASVQANSTALAGNQAAANGVATAQTAAGQAIDKAAAAALLGGKSWVQLSVVYADAAKKLANAVEVADKAAKAHEVEGRALEKLAELRHDERALLEASTKAAEGNLAALENLASKREAEVAALQRHADQLKAVIVLEGDADGSRAKQLETIQRKIDLLSAETEKTRQQVIAAREDVAAKQLARQAYEDNSDAVDRLRQAMLLAQQVMRETQILEINGKATRQQVDAATLEAAKSAGLYNDALGDYARRVQQQIEADRLAATIKQGTLSIDAERARSLAALAKNTGDETLATYAAIKAKEVERDQRLANAKALQIEADGVIRLAEANRAELLAKGKLTPELEREIDLRVRAAEIKRLEADRINESTKALDQEIDALRRGKEARDSSISSIDRENESLSKNVELRKKAAEGSKTSDGFKTNADGSAAGTFGNGLPVDQAYNLVNSGGKGFSVEDAKAALAQAKAAYDDMQSFMKLNPGAAGLDYQQSTTALYNGARAAYEKVQAANGLTPQAIGKPKNSATASTGDSSATSASSSTNHTVTINLGGLMSTFNMASADDAAGLSSFLKNLESAAGRSV
jgi:tape measure domain-containing protein